MYIWEKLVTRPMTLLTVESFLYGLQFELPRLTSTTLDVKTEIRRGMAINFEESKSRERLDEIFKSLHEKDRTFLCKHLKEGYDRCKTLLKVSQTATLSTFFQYFTAFYSFSPFLYTVFSAEKILTEALMREVESEEILRVLTFVEEESDFYKEQENLLKIAKKYHKNQFINDDISKHVKRFGYMGLSNSFLSKPYNERHFEKLISQIANPQEELQKLTTKRLKEKSEYSAFIKNLSPDILRDAQLLQMYMKFRNERIKTLKLAQHHIKPILSCIAKRNHITLGDIVWYRIRELECLAKEGARIDVGKRKEYASEMLINNELIYTETEQKQILGIRNSVLKGYVASKGNTRGKAKIILSLKDLDKLHQGDILITKMTTPDLVVAMRKAAAIVTDEGGVLSHAAIVSREFGIPCIVGTLYATEVFHDNDHIEVNTDQGVVRLL